MSSSNSSPQGSGISEEVEKERLSKPVGMDTTKEMLCYKNNRIVTPKNSDFVKGCPGLAQVQVKSGPRVSEQLPPP